MFLPNRHFDVRLTRAEFEDMIRAQIESTIGALTRTLRSAGVEPDELDAVLLVGGSSRIPLVGRMITEALDRPTLIDAHPKYAVALGAATLAVELAPHGADPATRRTAGRRRHRLRERRRRDRRRHQHRRRQRQRSGECPRCRQRRRRRTAREARGARTGGGRRGRRRGSAGGDRARHGAGRDRRRARARPTRGGRGGAG